MILKIIYILKFLYNFTIIKSSLFKVTPPLFPSMANPSKTDLSACLLPPSAIVMADLLLTMTMTILMIHMMMNITMLLQMKRIMVLLKVTKL